MGISLWVREAARTWRASFFNPMGWHPPTEILPNQNSGWRDACQRWGPSDQVVGMELVSTDLADTCGNEHLGPLSPAKFRSSAWSWMAEAGVPAEACLAQVPRSRVAPINASNGLPDREEHHGRNPNPDLRRRCLPRRPRAQAAGGHMMANRVLRCGKKLLEMPR